MAENKAITTMIKVYIEKYESIFHKKVNTSHYVATEEELLEGLIRAVTTMKPLAHFIKHRDEAHLPCSCGGITVFDSENCYISEGWGKSYFVRYIKCLDCGRKSKGFNSIDYPDAIQLAVEDWMQNYEELNEPSEFIINNGQVKRIKDSFEFLLGYINPEKSDKIEEIRDSINSIYAVLNEIKSFNYPEIADNLENEVFKEVLGDCYGYDASGLSDDDIKTFRDDVADILSNDDSYNEAYNDAVHSVAEKLNLKRLDDDCE